MFCFSPFSYLFFFNFITIIFHLKVEFITFLLPVKVSISEGIGKMVWIFSTFIVMHSAVMGGVWPIPVLRRLKLEEGREG